MVKFSYLVSAGSHALADVGTGSVLQQPEGSDWELGFTFCVFKAIHTGSVTS